MTYYNHKLICEAAKECYNDGSISTDQYLRVLSENKDDILKLDFIQNNKEFLSTLDFIKVKKAKFT